MREQIVTRNPPTRTGSLNGAQVDPVLFGHPADGGRRAASTITGMVLATLVD